MGRSSVPIKKQKEVTAFDYKDEPSIWTRDAQLRRYAQGDDFAKKRQHKMGINAKNQVFVYSRKK